MSAISEEFDDQIDRWLAADPDPQTRQQLEADRASGDHVALHDAFAAPLRFGTAGLRGPLGAGPTAMNSVVVRRAAAALVEVVGPKRLVVAGDARTNSERFVADVAGVALAAGVEVTVLPSPQPTPILAHAVVHLGADAGVMVTASHNPAGDNGLKLYLGDGRQIVAPVDQRIEAAIAATPLPAEPLALPSVAANPAALASVERGYLAEVVDAAGPIGPSRPLVVATAMHGVGAGLLNRAFAASGLERPVSVVEQEVPDPAFPTVAFPNPEEPGALDLAMQRATAAGADLIVALDPDADRLGVAVPGPRGWRQLSGDDLGALLADHVLAVTAGADRVVATTIVSSTLLSAMAATAGVEAVRSLTGFKWISRAADGLDGRRLVFGYEEALGYAVGRGVRDKDGIGAAVAIVAAWSRLAGRGVDLGQRLDELALEHGVHHTSQLALRMDPDSRDAAMARCRRTPPSTLGPAAVVTTIDRLASDGLPPTDALEWHLADGSRIMVRPSGTEPKLKVYVEVVEAVIDSVSAARRRAQARVDALVAALRVLLTSGTDQ